MVDKTIQINLTGLEVNMKQTLACGAVLFSLMCAATPASAEWDRKMRSDNGDVEGCGSTRFTCVLGRQAVRDNETGLVWQRQPEDVERRTWDDAIRTCWQLTISGRLGWRLPSIEELSSLVDPSAGPPTLPSGHPFINVQSDVYISATTDIRDEAFPTQAWFVGFDTGHTGDTNKTSGGRTWCVRGGEIMHLPNSS